MDSITIGFSRPTKWKPFSWLIMTAYGTPYDHVYVRWYSAKLERDIVYQASGTMVNFMGQQFFNNNVIVDEFEVPITPEHKLALIQFAMDNAGKPYGVKNCFGLAWVRICQMFGKKVSNPFKPDGNTYVCSELAAYVLQEFENVTIDSDIANITPLEVYNYLMQVKATKIV